MTTFSCTRKNEPAYPEGRLNCLMQKLRCTRKDEPPVPGGTFLVWKYISFDVHGGTKYVYQEGRSGCTWKDETSYPEERFR